MAAELHQRIAAPALAIGVSEQWVLRTYCDDSWGRDASSPAWLSARLAVVAQIHRRRGGIFSAAWPMLCVLLINAKPTRWPAGRLQPVLLALGLVAEGEDRRLDAVLQGELGENAADVGLDGLLADRQIPGDLPVAVTAGDQPEYFPLTR